MQASLHLLKFPPESLNSIETVDGGSQKIQLRRSAWRKPPVRDRRGRAYMEAVPLAFYSASALSC